MDIKTADIPTEQRHPTRVLRYEGGMEALARDIADLRYDALAELLSHVAECVASDSQKDTERGRTKLGGRLYVLAAALRRASGRAQHTWTLCKPHMK